jgi:hypothetical protein
MKTKTNLKTQLTIALWLVVIGEGISTGAVIYVDADAAFSGDGTSWAEAYKYLQHALQAAESDDEIRVAKGVYKPDEDTAHPSGTGDRSATFHLKNGVAIEIDVSNNDKHLGDLYVAKSRLIWCKGKTSQENGKRISWTKFIETMEKLN